MMRCNEVERAAFRFPMRRQDWELLEKYAKKYKDSESGQFAQEMLDMKRGNYAPEADDEEADELSGKIYEIEETPFSDLDEDNRIAVEELLEDNINEFMIHKDYIPEGKDLQDIADWVLKETNAAFYLKVVPNDAYRKLIDDTIRKLVREWKDDGMEIKTYTESLTVMETERLIIRKITRKDMGALLALMSKPEVMYAWEHGFEKKEVHQWLNRQLTRYRKDGYGYFAVILKENNKFIGQAGLMKSVIDGNNTVELGYMLDNVYWHHGYATEAARRCLQHAFEELGLQEVCFSASSPTRNCNTFCRTSNASQAKKGKSVALTVTDFLFCQLYFLLYITDGAFPFHYIQWCGCRRVSFRWLLPHGGKASFRDGCCNRPPVIISFIRSLPSASVKSVMTGIGL